jgi:hypothetical protein
MPHPSHPLVRGKCRNCRCDRDSALINWPCPRDRPPEVTPVTTIVRQRDHLDVPSVPEREAA